MSRIKYSRTPHLLWSPGFSPDDTIVRDCTHFNGRQIVVTEKMDGECTTIYSDGYTHARSVDSSHHPSRSWIKQLASLFAHEMPTGWRICGENLFAFHSILYKDLPSYFFVFGIYDENNICLPWKETEEFCSMLRLETVPVLYRGLWNQQIIKELWSGQGRFPTFSCKVDVPSSIDDFEKCDAEGYVVRTEDGFAEKEFAAHVAKWVRPHHVQTDSHWMSRSPYPNLLKV